MFEELALGGLLFSPLVVMIPIAFAMSVATRLILYKTGLYRTLWKASWFEVALFICYLTLVVWAWRGN
ncbi:DUF1656 domain-containing protein [Alteromonas pelagimontana]|uniref:DUF1656 domain-containing protein n=1 Tax=Alteromonas pelagimontana TaxID=1858656 RepID=A0A6M4MDD7_9ALTE|nr:DUF1656 domain-containing protein [Alteromonas pelagimontana]QJR81099.1 DUF1656 domain-containing protein [Alteromonas pelagimontana]